MKLAISAPDHRRVNLPHGTAEREKHRRKAFQFGSLGSSVNGFPGDGPVVHGDKKAVGSRQTSHDVALVHAPTGEQGVEGCCAHPWTEGKSEPQYMSSFLFSFFHLR